jgi:hypothetical protein
MNKSNNIDLDLQFTIFISANRNKYLTSSIGILLLTFAKNFKNDSNKMRFIGVCVLFYSLIYGLKINYDFYNILKKINIKELDNENKNLLSNYYNWIKLSLLYLLIIIAIIIFIIFKRFL